MFELKRQPRLEHTFQHQTHTRNLSEMRIMQRLNPSLGGSGFDIEKSWYIMRKPRAQKSFW